MTTTTTSVKIFAFIAIFIFGNFWNRQGSSSSYARHNNTFMGVNDHIYVQSLFTLVLYFCFFFQLLFTSFSEDVEEGIWRSISLAGNRKWKYVVEHEVSRVQTISIYMWENAVLNVGKWVCECVLMYMYVFVHFIIPTVNVGVELWNFIQFYIKKFCTRRTFSF